MAAVILIMAILVPLLLGAAFLLGRHLARHLKEDDELSAVSRQHIDLFQGGQLNEAAVESAKTRYRYLLERGQLRAVEASLRPGTQYIFQVQALAEIGTDDAGRILERQLQRRLSEDQLEQSWYWIDLARSLRTLHREESLPHLLRCAEQAAEIPLGHYFAAETVCFLGFAGYLRHPDTPLGRSALRILHRALEGLRYGVPPQVIAEARLGEVIEKLWDNRPEYAHAQLAGVAHETLRVLRRQEYLRLVLAEERAEEEAFDWQMSHLTALEPVLSDYLDEAPRHLAARLSSVPEQEAQEILAALADLKAEAGAEIMKLLSRRLIDPESAFDVLACSRHPEAGYYLRDWICRHVPMVRRAQSRKRAFSPRRPSIPEDVAYPSALCALRGHPSPETEACLILAAKDWDPAYRAAAMSSLGWWEPANRRAIVECLNEGRRDLSLEVRKSARGALARLGERHALQWFRQALTAENPQHLHEAIQDIASEGLTLLWPDLDRLADSDDPDIVHSVREALERLCEDMERKT
jgi:hypothetical protein